MLVDERIGLLARSVLEGDVEAVAPLLDRLKETGDIRVGRLERMLVLLAQMTWDVESIRQKATWAQGAGDLAEFRCLNAWKRFRADFGRCFWFELDGWPLYEVLPWIARTLDTRALARNHSGKNE